jgi:DNA-binding NtrC family response regulator/tetratricopeptide (TPR) repeat protein
MWHGRLRYLREPVETLVDLVGDSPGIVAVREQVRRLLQRQSESRRQPPILIQGETGTGKGLVARIIHAAGPRAPGPFVDVNCAAIPGTLLEAELFGFEKGAFTDARQAKPGLFQVAHRGTLFLDEVGLLPEGLQAKLLKAIEEREVRRLGSTRSEPIDVSVLAATSEDLAGAIRARRFREDLYHRLAVVAIALPPLRERSVDIVRLAEHFLTVACRDYGLPPRTLGPDARAALRAYPWPGNLRELANVMERVALLSDAGTVTAAMLTLPESLGEVEGLPREEVRPLAGTLRSVEREHLLAALGETGGNITHAAARLGISRNTLRYRLEKHGLLRRPSRPIASPAAPAEPLAAGPVAPIAPAPLLAPAAAAAAERRPLTLLRARLAAEAAGSASDASRAFEALVEKAESFGGQVEELEGIGIDVTFGLEPLEDAPIRAAHAALAMLHAAERGRRSAGAPPVVTLALHAGQVALQPAGSGVRIADADRRQADDVLAALLARAEPGTILVSSGAAPFLARRFDLTPLGPPEERHPVYRLGGREHPATGIARRMARFVGRQHDLELLESRLASTVTGRGQVVGIAGEAGIGKTRLLFEFRQRLAADRVAYGEGHCLAYGSAMPYLPLLDLLRDTCAIAETDTPEEIGDKVRAALSAVGMDAKEAAPYLLQLLGVKEGTGPLGLLSPEAIKGRTFETLRQMALRGSRQRPLVLAIENLHWIDRTSEEYLTSLVESLAGAPILLLFTYRPGYRPPGMEKSYATQVALQALAAADSLSLVRSFLATQDLPEDVARVVLDKAEGNPFFLEELGLAVLQHGQPHLGAALPDTIQEALMARIDRLPDAPKRVLQTASVLGREFSLRLLGALWPGAGGLDPHLVELKRLEFLYEQSGGEEPTYVFKHALTQEVAYESLAPTRRRALHAAAGRTLEALYAERLSEVYERLAYHYARTDEAALAVRYLVRAADKAARHYAHAEAVGALAEAARHAERLPAAVRDQAALDAALRQAHSLYFLGRFPESLALLQAERERVVRLGDPRLAGPYHFWLGHTESHLGDHASADRSARRALDDAASAGDDATAGKARYVLARGGFWAGRFREGVEHGRAAVALLERAGERWWLGLAHWGVAFNHGFLGEFDAALEAVGRTQAIGDAIEDPRLRAYAAWTTGWIRAGRGESAAAIAACQQSLDRSPDPVNTADALSFLGAAYVGAGDAASAIPLLTRAVGEWQRFRHRPMLGWFTAILAEAMLLDGQLDRARELATEAAAVAGEAGFPYGAGLAGRALGGVAEARGDLVGAASHLAEALATFGRIEARAEESRTHLACAVVACARGDVAAAAVHLDAAVATFRALRLPVLEAQAASIAARLGLKPAADR